MIALFWLQVALEISGAVLFFRRRLFIIYLYCGFSATADLAAYAIRNVHPLYGWFIWSAEGIQYAILAVLACQIAARLLGEYRRIAPYACMLILLLGGITGFAFAKAETWAERFLDAEAAASLGLAVAVGLAWLAARLARKKRLEEPWKAITLGLLVSSGGTAVCAALSSYRSAILQLYPIPAILALLVWNWSVLPRKPKPIALEEFRPELPAKIQVTSVGKSEILKMFG